MPKRVLIVDDMPIIRMIMKEILSDHEYIMIGEAENGAVGFDMFCELNPDIVLIDINMPKLNGIDAIKLMMEKNPEAKIIVCSAILDNDIVNQVIALGARDIIHKPFTENQLIQAIDKIG